jgi:hypothetical protein
MRHAAISGDCTVAMISGQHPCHRINSGKKSVISTYCLTDIMRYHESHIERIHFVIGDARDRISQQASAATAADSFYRGKTIRVIVGFAAGGGFDQYARTIARHMPKHIPGNPAMIVDNMTGAGSRLAANYLYKASAPDGLTIGNFIGSLLLQ